MIEIDDDSIRAYDADGNLVVCIEADGSGVIDGEV